MKNNDAQRNSILMILILFCTITIIWTNYIFTKKTINDINKTLIENEYKKIWWKENYLIMQEIQKREIIWYIDKIKAEQPELIKEILEKKDINIKKLNQNIIDDLKKDTTVLWNSWALISIIEFSDLECTYCIKQHKSWINNKILESYSGTTNYIFKNFPLPIHKNAKKEAVAAKCVEKLNWWEKYLKYIDNIFNTTKWGWEWFKINTLSILAQKLEINKDEFEKCLNKWSIEKEVEREFKQWIMLWINSVPSKIILNNKTWKYYIINEIIGYKELEKIINEISK